MATGAFSKASAKYQAKNIPYCHSGTIKDFILGKLRIYNKVVKKQFSTDYFFRLSYMLEACSMP